MAVTRQIIRGGRLLDAAAHTAEPADILLHGDTIAEIGPPGLAAPADAAVVDASDRLLLPGLVNGHTHGNTSFGKGMGDRWTLELLLNAHPLTGVGPTPEEKYLAAKLSACEMALLGCTAFIDMFAEFPLPSREGLEAAGQAYIDVGIRAAIAPMMATRSFYQAIPGLMDALPDTLRDKVARLQPGSGADAAAVYRNALQHWPHDREMVKLGLGPTIPHHCDEAFWRTCRDLARDFDTLISSHLAESRLQAVASGRLYGKTLAAFLDEMGVIGPNFVAAHAIWLTDDDIALLGDKGASVSHNPMSNLRLGSGVAAVQKLRAAGVNVAVGTDGCTCADALNMFEATRLACTLSRVHGPDYTQWLGSAEALAMATENGAKALGWGNAIGRIAPGYKADIVMLDLDRTLYWPLNDATNQVVFAENGGGVRDVMVGGRVIVADGRLVTVDMAKLRADVERAIERHGPARAAARDLVAGLTPHVGPYCAGFAAQPYPVNRFVGSA